MSRSYDFGSVDRVTAGAIGPPGERTFYVQVQSESVRMSFLCEKEQVRMLGDALLQLLAQLPGGYEGEEPPPDALELVEPAEPEWRVGEMAIAYEEELDRIAIVLRELESEEDDDLTPQDEPAEARFVTTRAQARAMAVHVLDVVARGRPRCQLCGSPVEAGGEHFCPSRNGHREDIRL